MCVLIRHGRRGRRGDGKDLTEGGASLTACHCRKFARLASRAPQHGDQREVNSLPVTDLRIVSQGAEVVAARGKSRCVWGARHMCRGSAPANQSRAGVKSVTHAQLVDPQVLIAVRIRNDTKRVATACLARFGVLRSELATRPLAARQCHAPGPRDD